MRFNSVLVSSLLLVCTVLADNRPEEHQTQFVNSSSETFTNIVARDEGLLVWAGARLQSPRNGNVPYKYSEAVFAVPEIWAYLRGQGFSIMTGIGNSAACPQSQVNFSVGIGISFVNNDVPYKAWASWDSDLVAPQGRFDIGVGDLIKIGLGVTSPQSGYYYVNNLSKSQSWSGSFQKTSTVCQQAAEWAISVFQSTIQDNFSSLLPAFSSVTFVNATATRSDGSTKTPGDGAYINSIVYNSKLLTDVWVLGSTMVILADRSDG